MQTHSLEQVQTAIRNAQAAGDAGAVAALKDYEEDIKRDIAMLRAIAPPRETGVVEDVTSGFGAGVIDVGELALLGGAAALEEEAELAAREKIKAGAAALRPEGGDPDSISYQISQALGSIAGLAAVPATAAVAGAPGAAAIGLGALAAAGAGAGEASERARAAGATEEERGTVALRGAGIGLLDILPIARVVKFVDLPALNKILDKIPPEKVETIGERIRSAGVTGGAEAAQEAASNVLQNLNAREYDALAEAFDITTAQEAALGGSAGAILQGLVDLFTSRKRGKTVAEVAEEQADDPEIAGLLEFKPERPTQLELFDRGDIEGPRGDPTAQAERDRLFEEEPSRAVSPDQESFLPVVGPLREGLPAPEVEERAGAVPKKATSTAMRRRRDDTSTIAGETLAVTPEGQALTREEVLARINQRDKEQRLTEQPVSDEARTGRERAEIAKREQGDLFPTELAIAEQEAQRRAEVASVPEPVRMTGAMMLDTLEVPAKAPIRKEIKEDASLDDPIVSVKTGKPIINRETKQPVTVRERLVRYGKNKGSKKLQDNIDRLLKGEPDGVSTRQRDLSFPTRRARRGTDEAGSRVGVPSDLQRVEDDQPRRSTEAPAAPVREELGVPDSGAGRVTGREGKQRSALMRRAMAKARGERAATKKKAPVVREPEAEEFTLADADVDTQAAELNARVEQLQSEQEAAAPKSRSAVGAKVAPPRELQNLAAQLRAENPNLSLARANDLARQELEGGPEVRIQQGDRDKYLMHVKDMSVDPKMASRAINISPTAPMFGSANAAEAIDIPLQDSVIDKINAGDTRGALEALAKTAKDRRLARVARKLMKYVGSTETDIVNIQPLQATSTVRDANNIRSMLDAKDKYGQNPLGLFVPKENRILLNTDGGLNGVVFLHEMTHAATLYEIATKPKSATVVELDRIYEAAKEVLGDGLYGVTDLKEFVAEAFANPRFQRDLARINAKGEPLSLFQRFKGRIARFIGLDNYSVFGDTSAQAEVNRLVDKILAASPERAGLDNIPSLSTKDGVQFVADKIGSVKSKLNDKQGREKIKRDFFGLFSKDMNPRMRKLMRGALSILPNQAVFVDIAEKAGITGATELNNAILEQRGALTKAEEKVRKTLDPLVRWSSKASKETIDAFNNLVYDSTIDEVDPQLTLKEATDKYGRQTVEGTNQLKIDRYKELRKVYDSGAMGEEGRRAYTRLRGLYADIYKDLRRSLLGRIDGLNVDEGVKTSLKNDLFARMLEASKVEPYFPLTRKGKYWLVVQNPADGERAVTTYETLGDRDFAKGEFEGMGFSVESIDPDNMKKYVGPDAPSGSFVAQVLSTLNDAKVPQSTREQIARLYIEALPESSFSKTLLKRKKTLGYDVDAVGAARTKAYDLARQSARIRSSNKIEAVRNAVREEFYARELDSEGKPTREFARSDLQNDRDKGILEEMEDRADFAISPPADNYAKAANRGAFIWTIGFNASSALVNLSQVPLFAYPMLAGQYGYGKSKDAILGAQKLFISSYVPHAKEKFANDPEEGAKFSDKYTTPSLDNYYVRTATEDGGSTLSIRTDLDIPDDKRAQLERIRPLIELAADRGELSTSFLAETLSVDQSGRETSLTDKMTNLSAVMFHNAEVMNRQTTMVAAYELELNKLTGGKEPTLEQKQAAAEEALYQTQQINGGATLETGPRLAREGIGRVALMYKSYGIQMYYTMLKTAKGMVDTFVDSRVAGGSIPQSAAASLKSDAFKQLAGIHLSALLFAGAQGLPLYGAVSMIYDMLQDDYEEDADTALRSYLDNDVLYKGLLSELTGLDVSQRVKLTDLLFEADKFNSDPSPEESFLHLFGGPAWSVGSRFYEGALEVLEGTNVERGAESMMPGALRNLYKAVVRYPRDEGILTRRGDPIYDDLTFGDIVTQILGFPPVKYTRQIEEASAAKGMEAAAREKRAKLLKRYYIARRFGDYEEARKMRRAMDEFNRTNIVTRRDPSLRITSDTIDRSMRRHETTSAKMVNGILLSPYMSREVKETGYL